MRLLDVYSAWVICGAGLLVGAAMFAIVRSDEARLQRALTLAVLSFGTMGAGLLPLLFQPAALSPFGLYLVVLLTGIGMLAFTWALGSLAGHPLSAQAAALQATLLLAVLLAALQLDLRGLGRVYAACQCVTGWLAVWNLRSFIRRPRGMAERALGIAMLFYSAVVLLRLVLTMLHAGPYPDHLLHAPAGWRELFTLVYGVMPVLVAALVLGVLNERLRQRLHAQATTDALTGALSRRAMGERAAALLAAAQRAGTSVAVIILDLDHFKQINDRFGHSVGDLVLQRTSAALSATLRADSLLVRYGGEEFVALVPVPGLPEGRSAAERLCAAVSGVHWGETMGEGARPTASVGVALLEGDEHLERCLSRADKALYRAKAEGRNRVQVALQAA